MKINKFWFPVIVLIIFFGTIVISMAAGTWKTEGGKAFKMIGGKLDLTSIRGSHKIAEIVQTFHLNKKEFYDTFELPSSFSPTSKLKDMIEIIKERHPDLGDVDMNYIREKLDELINKKKQ